MVTANTLIEERERFLRELRFNKTRFVDFLGAMAPHYKQPLARQIGIFFHATAQQACRCSRTTGRALCIFTISPIRRMQRDRSFSRSSGIMMRRRTVQLCVRFLHPRTDGEARQIASSLLAAATRKRAIPNSSPWEAPTSRFRALV